MLGSSIFMIGGHLRIEWGDKDRDEVIRMIQTKMDQGVEFFILDEASTAMRNPLVKIETTEQVIGQQVYISDPDIKHLVEGGFAKIATFTGMSDLKTVGKAKTATQAAQSNTIATAPKKGG